MSFRILILLGLVLFAPYGATQDAADNCSRCTDFKPKAIKVPLPDVQQPEEYSCGAASLMSILAYFGVGTEDYFTLKKRLGTSRKEGTDYNKIVAYAEEVGLKTKVWKNMKPEQLDRCLDDRHPVICSIQAYTEHPKQAPQVYYDKNINGHFVVTIGYDDKNYYFMDPSLTGRRGYLPRREFVKRWHDNEGRAHHPDIIEHLGLEIWSDRQPVYAHRARFID